MATLLIQLKATKAVRNFDTSEVNHLLQKPNREDAPSDVLS